MCGMVTCSRGARSYSYSCYAPCVVVKLRLDQLPEACRTDGRPVLVHEHGELLRARRHLDLELDAEVSGGRPGREQESGDSKHSCAPAHAEVS